MWSEGMSQHPDRVLADRALHRGFLLLAEQLARIAGLPTDLAVPGLDRAGAKPMPSPVAVPPGGRGTKPLGTAQVGGHPVALPVADARQHLHVLGSTGCGKSTFLTHLILDDIANRRGVVVIDPKGDLAGDVLDRLPVSVADRLVVIDPDPVADRASGPCTAGDRPRRSPMGTTDQHSDSSGARYIRYDGTCDELAARGVEPAGAELADGTAAVTGDVHSARCDG
jgi:hypothetical protein